MVWFQNNFPIDLQSISFGSTIIFKVHFCCKSIGKLLFHSKAKLWHYDVPNGRFRLHLIKINSETGTFGVIKMIIFSSGIIWRRLTAPLNPKVPHTVSPCCALGIRELEASMVVGGGGPSGGCTPVQGRSFSSRGEGVQIVH